MKHLGLEQLDRFLDRELDQKARAAVQAHLDVCGQCRRELAISRELCAIVRDTRPDAQSFSREGEFWARLAGQLPETPDAPWSWITYLPAFVLGVLGSLVQILLSAVLAGLSLGSLGIVPPIGPMISERLPAVLTSPLFKNSVYGAFGWPSEEVMSSVLLAWEGMGHSAQNTLVLGAILIALGTLLSFLLTLFVSWVMYWPRTTRQHR